ncbi:type VI secretion system baseplate subunit TssE [Candidatus Sneabacter namystus]|uniref:Type VI secretion system baseplate subunit TssE n=1 Tax=Candidatus Sneabacter namystus TaxID=2601646 RepID=A0A5C0UIH2_9RICK|nr:type VI secretion system baseplate subunit TssE [Candidatus Sneabacter namystus]QEK39908.1 type VI secretion system baseplate subunit TssE [Candidatus Sneabacter namystus]
MYAIDILLGYITQEGDSAKAFIEGSEEAIVREIVGDVTNLLNSRPQYCMQEEESCSILGYGIPDLSQYTPYSIKDRERVVVIIQKCLERFEPRLEDLSVVPVEKQDQYTSEFHFIIRAALKVSGRYISFSADSRFDSANNTFIIR